MPKFIKQRDDKSCVPLALLNLFNVYGRSYTYADLSWMAELVDCNQHGTVVDKSSAFHEFLISNFKVRRLGKIGVTEKRCATHLAKGKVMLASHQMYKTHGGYHLFLVTEYDGDLFTCVNYKRSPRKHTAKLSWQELEAKRTLNVWLID